MSGADDQFPAQALPVRDRIMMVQDSPSVCPYIENVTARMPLHFPIARLCGAGVDCLLAGGFRRSGTMLYYTRCAPCYACEATRLDANRFELSRSFRRVLRRAEQELTLTWQRPQVDDDRVRLYNSHRAGRDLGNSPPIGSSDTRHSVPRHCLRQITGPIPTLKARTGKPTDLAFQ